MRHRKKGRGLSRTVSHKKATMRNMATSLFRHERIETTTAKAKELRPFAERLITLGKRGTSTHAGSQADRSQTAKFSASCSTISGPVLRNGPEATPAFSSWEIGAATPRRWR